MGEVSSEHSLAIPKGNIARAERAEQAREVRRYEAVGRNECEARAAKCHQHCSRTPHGEANKRGDAHPHHTHAYTTRVVGERQGERPSPLLAEEGCRARRRRARDKSSEPRLNLSGSWQQGHSAAYNTPFLIQVVCKGSVAGGLEIVIADGS